MEGRGVEGKGRGRDGEEGRELVLCPRK